MSKVIQLPVKSGSPEVTRTLVIDGNDAKLTVVGSVGVANATRTFNIPEIREVLEAYDKKGADILVRIQRGFRELYTYARLSPRKILVHPDTRKELDEAVNKVAVFTVFSAQDAAKTGADQGDVSPVRVTSLINQVTGAYVRVEESDVVEPGKFLLASFDIPPALQ